MNELLCCSPADNKWIGLRVPKLFEWQPGYLAMSYKNFDPQASTALDANCVTTDVTALWAKVICTESAFIVCEKPAISGL